LKRKMI